MTKNEAEQNFSRTPRASPRVAAVLLFFKVKSVESVKSMQIVANATFFVVLLRSGFC